MKFLLLMPLSIFLSGCSGCGEGYSEGDRIGVITKFSHKGLMRKSWEGEVNLGGMRKKTTSSPDGKSVQTQMVANVWEFHCSDELAPKIQELMKAGTPVTLHYRQWAVSPWSQNSDYDVTEVTPEE